MPSTQKLRIALSGLAATYPFGGVFWDYMQYVAGFRLLGHDVLYVEDIDNWVYDPATETMVEGGAGSAARLDEAMQQIPGDCRDSWFFADACGQTYGRSRREAEEFCASADLFLNISASCWKKDTYMKAKVTALLDSDPMYTQASIPDVVSGIADPQSKARVDAILSHDVQFTFAENIHSPECLVPRELVSWIPTRQPVLFDFLHQRRVSLLERRRVLTTIGSTEPGNKLLTVRGKAYSGKSAELRRFESLQSNTAIPIELAMSGKPADFETLLKGWNTVPAFPVSRDPWVYLDYLSHSFGEWSVAKNAYVESRSGWFATRTACYLALGVPAIIQDTGLRHLIDHGQGVMLFSTVDEARAAIESLATHPQAHCTAAAAFARDHLDYRVVLPRLLEQAFA